MKFKIIDTYIDVLLEFLYPRNIYCIICDKSIKKTQKYSICTECSKKIKRVQYRACEKCGKPLEETYHENMCLDCIRVNRFFTKGFSCVGYEEITRDLVHRFKYKNERYLGYHMAEMMIEKLKEQSISIDLIVPVPLHKKRRKERGFNQSEILAKYIGRAIGVNVETKKLIRVKYTKPQNKLLKGERKDNLEEAFYVVSGNVFKNKNILIVDDVYTTGSTIDACSKELLKSEIKDIYMISFAIGKNI